MIGNQDTSCNYTDFCSDFDAYKLSQMLRENQPFDGSNPHLLSEAIERYYTQYRDLFTRRFTWIFEELNCQELRDDVGGFGKKILEEMTRDPIEGIVLIKNKGGIDDVEVIADCCLSFACYIYTMIH